eukprot:6454943-Amphidinium_carterae.1
MSVFLFACLPLGALFKLFTPAGLKYFARCHAAVLSSFWIAAYCLAQHDGIQYLPSQVALACHTFGVESSQPQNMPMHGQCAGPSSSDAQDAWSRCPR